MSITLTSREVSDLECLMNGSFSPLKGFMTRTDYECVVDNCHLSTGELWALPIVLAITEEQKVNLENSTEVILRDDTFFPLASMSIEDIYKPDLDTECLKVYGTLDDNHPSVKRIKSRQGYYIGGRVKQINEVQHYDFIENRLTPAQVKAEFAKLNWSTIVAFQTRNPLHRSHVEITKLGLKEAGPDAKLLLHPVVGDTQECDVDYFTRCKCYKKLIKYYPENTAMLSLLPYNMRMGGPREALQHAIIRQNYGCTHFIVGRDHAGPSYKTKDGKSFYGPYDAQQFVAKHQNELKIKLIALPNVQYVKDFGYLREDLIEEAHKSQIQNISGTEMRNMLKNKLPIPDWYTYPDIAIELQKAYNKQSGGLCIYFVGLSGSGKSTLANALKSQLMETEQRNISLLDGDVVRTHLSKGLGFSKQDRSTNVRRIGYVASEIVKHGGLVICANIAPYQEDRDFNRQLISQYGQYVEIFVDTDIETCEKRDVKGLYKAAREGKVKGFTGIDDPFEKPTNSDLIIADGTIIENVQLIINKFIS